MTSSALKPLPTFVDTHVHLWDLAHPTLTWNWIDTQDDHPLLGNIDQIKMQAFTMRALEAEARFSGAEAFVHVQAALGSTDPVAETRWLQQMAERHPELAAIVGHVDLGFGDAEAVVQAHLAASDRFRGVRDFAVEGYLASGNLDAVMERGLRVLASHQLVLDMDCEYPNMATALQMARRHPDLTIVLEHIGFPRRRDDEYFHEWSRAILALAEADNIVCKLSGIAMTDPGFTVESLRPWVETCLDAFGPRRCMIGSNWPLDRLFSSYGVIAAVYRELIGYLEPQEQDCVLRGTARETYSLSEPRA